MVLQSSGAISLSDIRGEFGGSAPDTISEYYRGAGLVPDTAANAGIPTSGAISLSDFYGGDASVTTVEITGILGSTEASSSIASCNFLINSDGTITGSGNLQAASGTWTPGAPITGFGNDYEVRATLVSGSTPGGSVLNSWLALSTNRAWNITDGIADGVDVVCTLLIEIRDVATSTVQDSANFTLSAERF